MRVALPAGVVLMAIDGGVGPAHLRRLSGRGGELLGMGVFNAECRIAANGQAWSWTVGL